MSRRRNECSTAQYGISFHAYVQSAATTCSDWYFEEYSGTGFSFHTAEGFAAYRLSQPLLEQLRRTCV